MMTARCVKLLGLALLSVSSVTLAKPASVTLEQRGHGWVLVDAKGMSLYTTVKDQQPGKSACVELCATVWPPLLVGPDEEGAANDEWSILVRDDGARQWAFAGQPLYRYSRDLAPGDSYGSDVDNEWTVATQLIARPAAFAVSRNELGYVLADARSGLTLYRATKDRPGKTACEDDCLQTWLPQRAPLMAANEGDWSVIQRADGIRQWAYRGHALYRYVGDLEPGETNGHRVDEKHWQAAILEPAPPMPSWVTEQGSDGGPLLADPNGKTLYGRTESRNRAAVGLAPPTTAVGGGAAGKAAPAPAPKRPNCGAECPGSPWSPVLAQEHDEPVGNWSIVDRADGKKQWAFKGEALYTHARDSMPGMLNGVRSGDRTWHPLMRSGRPLQGTGN